MKHPHPIRFLFDLFKAGPWRASRACFGSGAPHPMESLRIEQRADGLDSLLLTKEVGIDAFPMAARYYIALIGGEAGEQRSGAAEQVWELEVRGLKFFLCWDAHPTVVTLHPQTEAASRLIPSLRDELARAKGSSGSEVRWSARPDRHGMRKLRLEALASEAARHRRSPAGNAIPAPGQRDSALPFSAAEVPSSDRVAPGLPSLEEVHRDLASRLVGSICGGALGDALGGPYEGRVPPFQLDSNTALQLSDDTQMTLATCEAIRAGGQVDPEDVAASFLAWYRARRLRGMGASTLKAMRDLDAGAHWAMAGRQGEHAAGNGAAMRIAPLAFAIDLRSLEGRQQLRDVSRITHQSDEAYAGARAVAIAIQLMATDRWMPGLVLPRLVASEVSDSNTRDVLFRIADYPQDTPVREIALLTGTSGYVAESVPLAIFAAQRVPSVGLVPMLEDVIRAGGDTDTIASMAGQIGGAWLGAQVDGLPPIPDEGLILKAIFSLIDRLEEPRTQ